MSKKRLVILLGTCGFALVVCTFVGSYFWITRTKLLLSTDFPSGGKVEIYYKSASNPLFALTGMGGLTYQVSSNFGCFSGHLTELTDYDLIEDVELSCAIIDRETVQIIEACKKAKWRFSKNGAVSEEEEEK